MNKWGYNMDINETFVVNFIREELIELPNVLNRRLIINNEKINQRDEFFLIKNYVDDFINGNTTNRFLVMPGLRGVGKTTLLYQIYDYLLKEKNIPPKQILYISCEDLNNLAECNIRQAIDIYLEKEHDSSLLTLDKEIFLLIDESQYDKNWSLSGKIIYDKSDKIFMIFTGSSALDLEYNADSARRMVKKLIYPLNYAQYLKLKYNIEVKNISESLEKLIFTGDVEDAQKYEMELNDKLINNIDYSSQDWLEYVKYGGFPTSFNERDKNNISSKLIDISEKIVNTDMLNIKNITVENQANARRILRFLALQEPGDVSYQKLSNYLMTSTANVKNILDILEKTQLIFHCEPYGGSSKRIKKAWKYYFATSSLHNALASRYGITIAKSEQFEGVLCENLIASTLFNYKNENQNNYFSLYYDANKNDNVDFVIKEEFQKPIPIEVGRGKKDKRQIIGAIKRFNSDYGIIVSNSTDMIKKEDNVIFVPLKTFSFL